MLLCMTSHCFNFIDFIIHIAITLLLHAKKYNLIYDILIVYMVDWPTRKITDAKNDLLLKGICLEKICIYFVLTIVNKFINFYVLLLLTLHVALLRPFSPHFDKFSF